MENRTLRRETTSLPILGAVLAIAIHAHAQAPTKTNLRKVLVLDKSQLGAQGHFESRRDFNAALAALGAEKGFSITRIGQTDPASKIATEFSAANLATYQAVLFVYNDGVHAQLTATEKTNFETYVKYGGGFIPVHSASDFISNWPWLTSVLVESFYGPHGTNQPTANLFHDAEGRAEGTETLGIFKGLTEPRGFLDEFYSFRASPRGKPGVTILLTVDEKSYSKPVEAPMGEDHPVAWAKAEGKGRVVHISLGHSWSTNNVYTAKNNYLRTFLYNSLRYVAGDFLGCTDNGTPAYNPDATKSDPRACFEVSNRVGRKDGRGVVFQGEDRSTLEVQVREPGRHVLRMLDVRGRVLLPLAGEGARSYSLDLPAKGGIYFIEAEAGGRLHRRRVTVL